MDWARRLPVVLISVLACGVGWGCDRQPDPDPSSGTALTTSQSGPSKPSARALGPAFEELVKKSKPLAPQPAPQEVDGLELTAQICQIEGRQLVGKNVSSLLQAVEVSGDRLLVVDHEGQVIGFRLDTSSGCRLTLDEKFGTGGVLRLKDPIRYLSRDSSARVVASSGVFAAAYAIEDGKEAFQCKSKGHLELHASGTWAIAPWVNSTVQLVTIDGAGCKSTDWVLRNLADDKTREGIFKNVNASVVLGDLVVIGGVPAAKVKGREVRIVAVYDKAGREKLRFGNTERVAGEDVFGWIHAIQPCRTGICVLDSNYRQLTLWKKDGKHVGAVKLAKLFGLRSPWLADFTMAPDGSAYFVAAQNRDRSRVAEGLVVRVSGL